MVCWYTHLIYATLCMTESMSTMFLLNSVTDLRNNTSVPVFYRRIKYKDNFGCV